MYGQNGAGGFGSRYDQSESWGDGRQGNQQKYDNGDWGGRSSESTWREGGGGRGRGGGGGGFRHQGEGYSDEAGIKVEVANQNIARIIGKGGSKIRELEQDSGASIKVNKNEDNGTTTAVEIKGSPDAQARARQLIEDFLSSQNNQYDRSGGYGGGGGSFQSRSGFGGGGGYSDNATEIEVSSRDIGRIIGRGGSKIQELQQESGARIRVLKDSDNGSTTRIELKGGDDNQHRAKQLIEEITSQDGDYGGRPQRGFGGGRGGGNDGGWDSGYGRDRGGGYQDRGQRSGFGGGYSDTPAMEMEVSSRDVARIIGRGGSKIQELQQESGARIRVLKERDNGVTTWIELKGAEDAQHKAKQLIEDFTSESQDMQQ